VNGEDILSDTSSPAIGPSNGCIFVALDKMDLKEACDLAEKIGPSDYIGGFKAHALIQGNAKTAIPELHRAGGKPIWWDLKCHDMPDTVREQAQRARDLGAGILTVHIKGEYDMMFAALEVEGLDIFGISELTGLSTEMIELGSGVSAKASVLSRARMASHAGLHAVVCSVKEVGFLNDRRVNPKTRENRELHNFRFVVPGTRSKGGDRHDQVRTGTPEQAILDGADHLVIGRELTKADDPLLALASLGSRINDTFLQRAQTGS